MANRRLGSISVKRLMTPPAELPYRTELGPRIHLDAPHGAEVDVARLGRPVGRRYRNAVLNDGEAAQAEPRLRRPDAQTDAAGESIAPPVLHQQSGNAAEHLVERRAALREVDLFVAHHRHGVRHARQRLRRAGHFDRLGDRRNSERQVEPRSRRSDRDRGHVAQERRHQNADGVIARGQPQNAVDALRVGDGAPQQAGLAMLYRHGRTRQHAADLVDDGADDRTGILLGRSSRCARHEYQRCAQQRHEGGCTDSRHRPVDLIDLTQTPQQHVSLRAVSQPLATPDPTQH